MKICGRDILVSGRLIRAAKLDGDMNVFLDDPEPVLRGLQNCGARIDLFTFMQRLPETSPKFAYPMEWDNLAVLPVSTFEHWWNEQIGFKARNKAKQAERKGVVIREVPFDDALVRGIWEVYNECPVRQGVPFTHYGEDIKTVYKEEATFLDNSIFIGAFLGDQLIGFVKLVYLGQIASIMQFLCKNEHSDKRPANALIAKTMEVCVAKGMRLLVYRKYTYGNDPDSQLTEFKRRNGFEPTRFPRYYVPLTAKGRVLIRLKLHGGLKGVLPENLKSVLVHLRSKWYQKAHSTNPAR